MSALRPRGGGIMVVNEPMFKEQPSPSFYSSRRRHYISKKNDGAGGGGGGENGQRVRITPSIFDDDDAGDYLGLSTAVRRGDVPW